ncbi:MAG: sigma-70 family RNA polymerase sigma factor [Oscillospiraceae bacterium]|jgi:RNA polymerase sigma-70 factor (ECF subfamily)|nr:sigma-70 family RNA polymerase sigma factor [Oscillospiraceae bacterium]
MDKTNIGALAAQAAAGDNGAFQTLYELSRNKAYFVALSIAKNETDAQDILQESYLRAYQNIATLKDPERFLSWMNQIVANQAKNYIARIRPMSLVDEDGNDPLDWQAETDVAYIPDEGLDLKETKELVHQAVQELPVDQRLCVLLHYFSELDLSSIASALEVPEGTVKSRLSRARAKLRERLNQDKKSKLYGIAPIPLVAYFLGLSAQEVNLDALPNLITVLIGATAAGAAGTASAAGSTSTGSAGAAVATIAADALSKVIVAVAAAALVVGGTIAGVVVAQKNKASSPFVPVSMVTQTEAAVMTTEINGTVWEVIPQTAQGSPTTGYVTRIPQTRLNDAAQNAPDLTQSQSQAQEQQSAMPVQSSGQQDGSSAITTATQVAATTTKTVSTRQSTATQATDAPVTAQPYQYSDGIINRYVGSEKIVVVPAVIDGTPVLAVGNYAFMNTKVEQVRIESGIQSIGWWAFANCADLAVVEIPSSVTSIDRDAFYGLRGVTIRCQKDSVAYQFASAHNMPIDII